MILVFGATGNVGGAVVRELAVAGSEVRAVVRQPEGASLPAGVEAVAGDLADVATLRPSLAGIDAAFLMSGYDGIDDLVPQMTAAGVERVVLLSSSAAPSADLSNAVARYHIMSEQVVRDAGVAWTFLQPNKFRAALQRCPARARLAQVSLRGHTTARGRLRRRIAPTTARRGRGGQGERLEQIRRDGLVAHGPRR
ncbi:MAG: SDR family oxidoreductase, partial [Candidatus Limnocylindrales bacterium]